MKHTGCLHFITLMNLLHLPTSVNCPQDIISHIQVVHRLQVKSMHSLIRVWFLNPFRLPSSQCEAYSQHLYKCQCCFVVDCILQILFSSYPISLSNDFRSVLWHIKFLIFFLKVKSHTQPPTHVILKVSVLQPTPQAPDARRCP